METMNPQERELLQDFLRQLIEIRGVDKDPEAQALIDRAVAQQPDAAYLLVQRALLLEQALNAAKARIAELQNAQGSGGGRGFLAGANLWGRAPDHTDQRSAASLDGLSMLPDPARRSGTPSPAAAPRISPFGGFLGQAAATAAGVAGGAFLFQGLESLLGHNATSSGHIAPQHHLDGAALDGDAPQQGDGDFQDITSDVDLDDFDSGDDSLV